MQAISSEHKKTLFFTVRVVKHWHRLCKEVVEHPSPVILKSQLDPGLGNLLLLTALQKVQLDRESQVPSSLHFANCVTLWSTAALHSFAPNMLSSAAAADSQGDTGARCTETFPETWTHCTQFRFAIIKGSSPRGWVALGTGSLGNWLQH